MSSRSITVSTFVSMLLASLIVTAITAVAADCIWSWFLASRYGEGPLIQEWFGIAAILDVMILQRQRSTLVSRPLAGGAKSDKPSVEMIAGFAGVRVLSILLITLSACGVAALLR